MIKTTPVFSLLVKTASDSDNTTIYRHLYKYLFLLNPKFQFCRNSVPVSLHLLRNLFLQSYLNRWNKWKNVKFPPVWLGFSETGHTNELHPTINYKWKMLSLSFNLETTKKIKLWSSCIENDRTLLFHYIHHSWIQILWALNLAVEHYKCMPWSFILT